MNNANRHNTRLVFNRFSDFRENLGNVKETPTRKTCFSREMKRLERDYEKTYESESLSVT